MRHQGFLCPSNKQPRKIIKAKGTMKALITRKVGMTSIIADNGDFLAVTLLSASPCTVTDVKNVEKDGYNAVQLGFEKAKKPAKPQIGQFKALKITPKIVREYRVDEISEDINPGDKLEASIFEVGEKVSATGVSKGKGFAGTIKRHNFQRGRKTHGGHSYRRPGSIGSMFPQKVFKGKRMAGRMGHDQVTVKNLKVAIVDNENQLIGVTGAVPGPRKGIVILKGQTK
jgi:large subunit ribosomal protein L3